MESGKQVESVRRFRRRGEPVPGLEIFRFLLTTFSCMQKHQLKRKFVVSKVYYQEHNDHKVIIGEDSTIDTTTVPPYENFTWKISYIVKSVYNKVI